MAYRFEKVTVGHEGQTLLPWSVSWFEMKVSQVRVFGAEGLSDAREQFCRHSIGLLNTAPLNVGLVVQDLAANNFVGPFVRYVQCAQRISQFIGVAPSCKPSG